jgi:hypothetical protein
LGEVIVLSHVDGKVIERPFDGTARIIESNHSPFSHVGEKAAKTT